MAAFGGSHFSHSFNSKLDDRGHFRHTAKTSVASLRGLIGSSRNIDRLLQRIPQRVAVKVEGFHDVMLVKFDSLFTWVEQSRDLLYGLPSACN
jgi:hypothetical protein